jgi:hypothetical protein
VVAGPTTTTAVEAEEEAVVEVVAGATEMVAGATEMPVGAVVDVVERDPVAVGRIFTRPR